MNHPPLMQLNLKYTEAFTTLALHTIRIQDDVCLSAFFSILTYWRRKTQVKNKIRLHLIS